MARVSATKSAATRSTFEPLSYALIDRGHQQNISESKDGGARSPREWMESGKKSQLLIVATIEGNPESEPLSKGPWVRSAASSKVLQQPDAEPEWTAWWRSDAAISHRAWLFTEVRLEAESWPSTTVPASVRKGAGGVSGPAVPKAPARIFSLGSKRA